MIFLVLPSTLPRNNQKIVFKTKVLSEAVYLFFIAVLFLYMNTGPKNNIFGGVLSFMSFKNYKFQ